MQSGKAQSISSRASSKSGASISFKQPLSYDYGQCSELLGFTLANHLDLIADMQPDAEALVSSLENKRLTYGEFKSESEIIARALMARGIGRGDRVGVWSANNWRWLTVLYATARIGAILVNINPAYRTSELDYVLKQSGVKLLFTIASNRNSDYMAMLKVLAGEFFLPQSDTAASTRPHSAALPDLNDIVLMPAVDIHGNPLLCESEDSISIITWDELLAQAIEVSAEELLLRQSAVQFDDAVNIQYTSGTTGFPKGVTLSHHNLLNNGYFAARAMGLDALSRFCVPMPFYHCGGMVSSALATLSVGGTLVLPAPYFEELAVMEAVQAEKCTHLSGVPTMFITQLEHPQFKTYDYSSLKGGFLAGAPCPVQLMRRVASEMHVPEVVILYGLTEVSPLMTATTTEDSMETRATTVGRAIPGVEVKVVDALSGEIVKRGSQGEICCRGHGIMLGYWQNQQATDECIDAAGWLHSGDLGVMNAEGYLHITGRKKDMIIRGGENIYPREIEEVLHHHPSISQAQVFGLPDARLGEEVALWLIIRSGTELNQADLIEWLKAEIAHFKVPRYIKFVEEFPMTVTGKVQKFAMRERMILELGLASADAIETA